MWNRRKKKWGIIEAVEEYYPEQASNPIFVIHKSMIESHLRFLDGWMRDQLKFHDTDD